MPALGFALVIGRLVGSAHAAHGGGHHGGGGHGGGALTMEKRWAEAIMEVVVTTAAADTGEAEAVTGEVVATKRSELTDDAPAPYYYGNGPEYSYPPPQGVPLFFGL